MSASVRALGTRWQRGLIILLLCGLALALTAAQSQHRYLIPPYENDFGGFAARAASLEEATRLDGFYPLGYPALLWLLSQGREEHVFGAAKAVAVTSSLLLVAASWGLARVMDPKGIAWLLPLLVACNPYFWESALFVGTDMPWAALQLVSLLLAVRAAKSGTWRGFIWSGAALGLAYLMRYTALVMLPVVWAFLWLWRPFADRTRENLWAALAFTFAFALVASPQLITSALERGNPFFTLQAKNVWFAIYGQGDWRAHWTDLRSDIGLLEVIALSPARFLRHWALEFAKWWAYSGVLLAGVSRIALAHASLAWRGLLVVLATVPFGLAAWLLPRRLGDLARVRPSPTTQFIAFYYVAYGLSVSLVFVQPRFYLALLPPLLLGGIAATRWLLQRGPRWLPASCLAAWVILGAGLNSRLALAHSLQASQPPVGQVMQALDAAGATSEDIILATIALPYAYHATHEGRADYRFQALPEGISAWGELESLLVEEPAAGFLLFDGDYGPRYWPALSALLQPDQAPSYLWPLWQGDAPPTVLYQVVTGN